jgi:hypothetical protein
MRISPQAIRAVAREIFKKPNPRAARNPARTEDESWKAFFGTTPVVAADIWNRLDPRTNILPGSHPRHLLYGFLLLKVYSTEKVHGKIVGVDEKTFRQWSWVFVDAISGLLGEVVSLQTCWLIVICIPVTYHFCSSRLYGAIVSEAGINGISASFPSIARIAPSMSPGHSTGQTIAKS